MIGKNKNNHSVSIKREQNRNSKKSFKSKHTPKFILDILKQFFLKVLCLILIANLLTLSVPAAIPSVKNATNELVQDIRFSFYAGGWDLTIPKIFAFFAHNSAATENEVVSRVRIYPGSMTVRENDLVVLSAVAFNNDNEPLEAPVFTWTISDSEDRFEPRALPMGNFTAQMTGVFTLTAVSGGQQAAVTITVTPTPAEEENPSLGKTGLNPNNIKNSQAEAKPDNELNLLPIGPGWEPGDTGSSDNPGNQPGNPPGAPADDGAGSGNFQLSAPVIALPGRGLDLSLSLNYNSRLWNKNGNQLKYNIDGSFPAPGWSLGFGKMIFMGGDHGCMLVDADGTRHGYTGTPHPYTSSASFEGYVIDNSFIDYTCNVSYGASGVSSGRAQLANGTVINYASYGPDNGIIYPTKITDVQGNYITITYVSGRNGALETITDTLGRVITFQYDANNRLISINAPRMTGQGAQYGPKKTRTLLRLHYRQMSLNYSFPGMTVVADNAPWIIDSIYYPVTNTGYWFGGADAAQSDYNTYYSSYGMLAKFEEQRGMSFLTGPDEQGTILSGEMSKRSLYNYPLTTTDGPATGRTNGNNLSDAPTYTKLTQSWAGMNVADDAVTTYDVQQNASPRVITVTQPNGSVSRQLSHNYNSLPDGNPTKHKDGMVFQDESYVEDPTGTVSIPSNPGKTYRLVGKSTVEWGIGYRNIPIPAYTEKFDENNHKIRTEFDYGGGLFNQIRFTCDYDNGGIRLRCASTEYENSPAYIGQFDGNGNFFGGRHILNLVKATGVNNPDAGATLASWTKYEYDANPLAATPGVVQHDPSYDPNNSDTYMVCKWVCVSCKGSAQSKVRSGNVGQQRCECDDYQCTDYPVFNPNTNARGNITKTTTYANAQDQTTGAVEQTSFYDITGNMIKASTSCCQQTSFEYTNTTQYAYPSSQTRGSADPNSLDRITTTTQYSFATGLVTLSIDANGRPTNNFYHPDTLRPTRAVSPTTAYTIYSYDDLAMTITQEFFQPGGFSGGVSSGKIIKILNGIGQTRREESVGPSNVSDFVDTQYNKFGQVWKQSRPYRAGDAIQWTTTTYDGQGRTVEVKSADDSSTRAFYNQNDAAHCPNSATTVGGNLLPGNTIRVEDAWGRERWARYDQQNRVVEVVEPKADGDGKVTSAGDMLTKYQYDTLGRLIQTEQIDQQPNGPISQFRKFKYDSLGRMTRQKLAEQTATLNDGGIWVGDGNTGAMWSEAFVYDNRSNLTQKTDARGVRTNYAYYNLTTGVEDPLNRVQAVIYDLSGPRLPDSVLPIHASYNVTYEYMTTGDKSRIKKVETPGLQKEEYEYDSEGRVQDYIQTTAYREMRPFKTSYEYDTLGRVTKVRYPEQYGMTGLTDPRRIVENSYDEASRLKSLKVNGIEQAGSINYNAADQVTSIKIGTAGTGQMTENYSFDPKTGRLVNQNILTSTGVQLLDLTYEYDRKSSIGTGTGKTGHISKIVDNLNGAKNRQYKYDALGRLIEAKGGDTLWQQTYTYDRFGNRTNVVATGVAADSSTIPVDGIPYLTYDSTSNRITTSGFQYDAAGNQIRARSENGTAVWLKYEYDAANRLRIIKEDDNSNNGDGKPLQAFVYGASNARIFDYDYNTNYLKMFATLGGTTISEYTEAVAGSPTWTKSYVYLSDSLLSTYTLSGANSETTEYSHPDRLGTRTITNQQAGTNYEQKTLPFGTALNAESTANTNNRFTSYDRSSATKLDYAINRQYDSKQGRFTQVDPIKMSAVNLGSPQTLNLYSYCGNDPINHTDPDGLFFGSFFKWLSKAFKVFNKILKWVVVAIAITLVVAAIVLTNGGAMPAFLGNGFGWLMGMIGKIGLGASSFMAGAIGVEVSASVGFSIVAGLYSVGAVANNFAQTRNRKTSKTPCPPNVGLMVQGIGVTPTTWFQNVINNVNAMANKNNADRVDSGRYKEVGGWILQSKDGSKYEAVIKTPEAEPVDTSTQVQLGEPRKHLESYLKKGWKIVGDFHSHTNKISNPEDVDIANARQNPGVWIYPDGTSQVYGPTSGILGVGIPKHCQGAK